MFLLYIAKTSWSYTKSYGPISINHEWINITSGEMHPKCWVPYTKNLTFFKYTTPKLQMQQTNARVLLLMIETWHPASCCCSGAFVCHMVFEPIIPGISWCWLMGSNTSQQKNWGNLLLGKKLSKSNHLDVSTMHQTHLWVGKMSKSDPFTCKHTAWDFQSVGWRNWAFRQWHTASWLTIWWLEKLSKNEPFRW